MSKASQGGHSKKGRQSYDRRYKQRAKGARDNELLKRRRARKAALPAFRYIVNQEEGQLVFARVGRRQLALPPQATSKTNLIVAIAITLLVGAVLVIVTYFMHNPLK